MEYIICTVYGTDYQALEMTHWNYAIFFVFDSTDKKYFSFIFYCLDQCCILVILKLS